MDRFNQQAVLRTAEGFGIQHVWLVQQPVESADDEGAFSHGVTKGAWRWLSLRRFYSARACIDALRESGREIWTTDLGSEASEASIAALRPLPASLAIVMGRESDGVSPEMHAAASRRLRLPMHGFTESFNLTVATGLMLQRLLDACPEARGDLDEAERAALRRVWYERLASEERREEYLAWVDRPPPPLEELAPPPELKRPRMPRNLERRLLARRRDELED